MARRPLSDAERAFLRELGHTIREVRREQGLLQEQLGARSGVTGSRIGEIERGSVDTSVTRIFAIADALGLSPAALLHRKELLAQDERTTEEARARVATALRRLSAEDIELLGQLVSALAKRA